MKRIQYAVLTAVLLLASCGSSGSSSSSTSSSTSSAAWQGPVRVIEMTAENFAFAPNAITLKKGEHARLKITGKTGMHGFAVPDLGINTQISEGTSVEVDIPTDRIGTFTFFCSIPCGPGHSGMRGTITITP